RERLALGERGLGEDLAAWMPRRARDQQADRRVVDLACRAQVQRRVVGRAREDQLAAFDREHLPVDLERAALDVRRARDEQGARGRLLDLQRAREVRAYT